MTRLVTGWQPAFGKSPGIRQHLPEAEGTALDEGGPLPSRNVV